MRILLISSPFVPTPPPTYGGTQRDVAILGETLAGMGHDVTVVASKRSTVAGCQMTETLDWKEGQTGADVKDDLARLVPDFWRTVVSHLKGSRNYDIVNSHAKLPGMPFAEVKSLCKKLCVSIHGNEGVSAPGNNIFVSAAHRDAYKETACYVHNPVDSSRYEYQERKQGYLSFIARLDVFKAVDIAIRVSKATGIPLKFAGNVADPSYFERAVKPHLNRHIEYVGQVGGKEKSDLLGRSTAVLCPTRLNPEPFGRVPLEGNACGTPVVAYRNGGLQEVVKHGFSGYLVGGEAEMAAALRSIAAIKPHDCRRWVEGNFNPRLIAERYLDLYERLIRGETWG